MCQRKGVDVVHDLIVGICDGVGEFVGVDVVLLLLKVTETNWAYIPYLFSW